MTIKCPECHHENPDDTIYCGKCTTPLRLSKDREVTETIEAPKEELTTGSTFAKRYQIIEQLGKGGMGNVYKAYDAKIKEKIALKLIKPEIAKDKKTIERFSNELRLARKIRHKNVCQMFDLGEEKGSQFITMEYVPGEDLRSLIRRIGQLPIGKSISIAKQICEGLSEAHRLGVVHRDLKSNNIMIDKEGNVRIMDFGIARSLETKGITGAGVMIGTPEYMSPEQVEGREVDQRSDIYSLGVNLYEMVTGRVPFEGDTPFTIGMKHKGEMPQNPKELNAQISDDLNHVILRCLEKDKEKRYQSAGEVRSELANIEKGIPATDEITAEKKPITSKEITVTLGLKKLLIPALAVVFIAIAAIIIWQLLLKKQTIFPLQELPSIAVLPFVDLSPQKDQEYLCDGMTDEIISKLSKLNGWKVIPRTSMMRYKDTAKDIREIGQELDIATILEGSVKKEGNDLRVNAKLIRVEDSINLWSDTYEKKLESIFDIQNDVAEKIAQALVSKLSPDVKELLKKNPTKNIEAYNLYLQGRYLWNKRTEEGLKRAIKYFEEAHEIDPNFALAYVGLADSYNMLGSYDLLPPREAAPKAKAAALKALEIDDTLAEAYTSLALVKYRIDWDWSGAEKDFKRAIELNPSYAIAHQWYGGLLRGLVRFDEALVELYRAQELDPLSLPISISLGFLFYCERQYDKTIEHCKKALEIDPNFSWGHSILAGAYLQKMQFEEAIEEMQKAVNLSGGSAEYRAYLGHAYALAGKRDEAFKILEELKEISKKRYISADRLSTIYIGLGLVDEAFEWLGKAYEDRSMSLYYLKVDPRFDALRSDPRFKAMLKRLDLDQ